MEYSDYRVSDVRSMSAHIVHNDDSVIARVTFGETIYFGHDCFDYGGLVHNDLTIDIIKLEETGETGVFDVELVISSAIMTPVEAWATDFFVALCPEAGFVSDSAASVDVTEIGCADFIGEKLIMSCFAIHPFCLWLMSLHLYYSRQ